MKKIFKKIVRYVSLVFILAFVGSCDKNEEGGKEREAMVYAEHCIPYYVEPNALVLSEYWHYNSEPGIVLEIEGTHIEERSNKEDYEVLTTKYGDVGYNYYRAIGADGAISVAIDSISVISDNDVDESHPKGTELSDMIKLNTRNYYDYIKSGYMEEGGRRSEKDKFISEYTKEDFTLLFNKHGLGFHFDSTMSVKGTHNLTISIYFEGGKILSTTQTVKFE